MDFDSVFIDAGSPAPATTTEFDQCIYWGPSWYAREITEAILCDAYNGAGEKITTEHFSMSFTANHGVAGGRVGTIYGMMDAAIEKGLQTTGNYARDYAPKLAKNIKLAMQGVEPGLLENVEVRRGHD